MVSGVICYTRYSVPLDFGWFSCGQCFCFNYFRGFCHRNWITEVLEQVTTTIIIDFKIIFRLNFIFLGMDLRKLLNIIKLKSG